MTKADLEARVADLESEVARLTAVIKKLTEPKEPWWKTFAGEYADDPMHDEAMRLGREWRESQNKKPRTRKKV